MSRRYKSFISMFAAVLAVLATVSTANCGAPAKGPKAKTPQSAKEQVRKYINRGLALAAAGKLAEAEAEYLRAVKLDPSSGAAYANLGTLYARRKQFDKAEQALRKAAELMPNDPRIYIEL
ncbi:MAG: tetratricopeptide repeat protein, partial [Armatimonadota bacterium]